MRNIICVCLADGEGHARYRRLMEYLKREEAGCPGDVSRTVQFIQRSEEIDVLLEVPEKTQTAVVFLISMDDTGFNLELSHALKRIAAVPGCLEGMSGGIIVVGDGEIYTKEAARKTAFTISRAGCLVPGGAFAEVTGSMRNLKNRSVLRGLPLEETFLECAGEVVQKAAEYSAGKRIRTLTCIHSSIEKKSNTYAYWKLIRENLRARRDDMKINEINLFGKSLPDCIGCPYEVCLRYGEQRKCFFGGVMTEEVYPAVDESDAILLLCPNYNDAIGANLSAFINRLTALYRNRDFSGKYLYMAVVSGYSGGELVAEQVIDAMALNKGFTLPGHAADIQMANHPGELLEEEGIREAAEAIAERICD